MEHTPSKIVQGICKDLNRRDEVGQNKYGTSMDRVDLTTADWLQHNYEELMDAVQYNRAAFFRQQGDDKALATMIDSLQKLVQDVASGQRCSIYSLAALIDNILFQHRLDVTCNSFKKG